jgi:hypothetical protein
MNKPRVTEVLLGEARRIIYALRLHTDVPREGMSVVDREIARRLFWQMYTTDKWVWVRRIGIPKSSALALADPRQDQRAQRSPDSVQ